MSGGQPLTPEKGEGVGESIPKGVYAQTYLTEVRLKSAGRIRLNRASWKPSPSTRAIAFLSPLNIVPACDGKQVLIDKIDAPNPVLIAADAVQHSRELHSPQRRRDLPLRLPRIKLDDGGYVAVDDRESDRFVKQGVQGFFVPFLSVFLLLFFLFRLPFPFSPPPSSAVFRLFFGRSPSFHISFRFALRV
jgi:hypothetical protein